MKAEEVQRLEEFIRQKMFEHRMPGLTIAVRDNDGEHYSRAFGYADVSAGIPVTPETCFSLASITKSFTALTVLMLAGHGKLKLNDPVTSHIPELAGTVFDKITIHHLLSHSSGISTLGSAERHLKSGMSSESADSRPDQAEESFHSVLSHAGEWTIGEPGEKFSYLNEGFTLLHDIVEKACGTSYDEYVCTNIIEPLGMGSTFFIGGPRSQKKGLIAEPYSTVESSTPVRTKLAPGTPGSGSLFSNVNDMKLFIEMLVNRGRVNGKQLFDSEDIELMEQIHVHLNSFEIGSEGPRQVEGSGYGYGLNISDNFLGHKLISHAGSILVHTSFMAYIPETGVYVIAFANTTGYSMGNIAKFALMCAMHRDPDELPFLVNERTMERISGLYETYRGSIQYTVTRRGDNLELGNNFANGTIVFMPESISRRNARFSAVQGGIKIFAEFTIETDGSGEMIFQNSRYKKRKN